ncbi:hypothetical protein [Thermococcus sp.]
MNKKAVFVAFLLLFLLSLLMLAHVNEKNQGKREWNTYVLSELRFQDNITMKAIDYARQYQPNWKWSVATFCIWPNETVTVLVYGNYTTSCKGYTGSNINGTLYAVNLNLTNLGLISFRKAPSSAYDKLIDLCEKVWGGIEKRALDYCHAHLAEKCQVLTYCLWPNRTITFLFHVNYTTVCRGYDCSDVNGTFYDVALNFTSLKPLQSYKAPSDGYYRLRNRCSLAWMTAWKDEINHTNSPAGSR